MFYKTNGFKLCVALFIGVIVFLLPRPEGTKFKITGDSGNVLMQNVTEYFNVFPAASIPADPLPGTKTQPSSYVLEANAPGSLEASVKFLSGKAKDLNMGDVNVSYVDGLSPRAKRFLTILAVLVVLFVVEPIPLEITAV